MSFVTLTADGISAFIFTITILACADRLVLWVLTTSLTKALTKKGKSSWVSMEKH
jgi:hypothetical protein